MGYEDYYRRMYGYQAGTYSTGILNVKGTSLSGYTQHSYIEAMKDEVNKLKVKNNLKLLLL